MTEELKNCAHCGSEVKIDCGCCGSPFIECGKCRVCMGAESRDALMRNWNRRASPWVSVEDGLPSDRTYVYIRHGYTNHFDSDHQFGVNFDVAKFVQGVSEQEREIMKLSAKESDRERARTYCAGDEWSNNLVPYCWETFGPTNYFGQDVTHWMLIPPLPETK